MPFSSLVSCLVVGWSTPQPPPIVNIADYGCAGSLNRLKSTGGTLLVPAGVWKCPPLNLTSDLTVYLKENATIKADTSVEWPLIAPLSIYGQGHDFPGYRYPPFLGGFNVSNLVIGGENGTVDGSGLYWWLKQEEEKALKRPLHTRPSLFECVNCFNITLQDVTFTHSSCFDPDSTSDVLLEDSYFHVNDDAIAIKAGWDCAGYANPKPVASDNITIRNLSVWHGGGGVSIGSEMSGGVSNVLVDGASLLHGSYGLQIKTGDTRGGYVKNVTMRNIEIVGSLKNAGLSLVNVSFDDRSFAECYGGVQGRAVDVSPVPPPKCDLEITETTAAAATADSA